MKMQILKEFLYKTKPAFWYASIINIIMIIDFCMRPSELSLLATILAVGLNYCFFYGVYFFSPALTKVLGSIIVLLTITLFYTTTIAGYNIQKHMAFILLFQTSTRELNMFLEPRNIMTFCLAMVFLTLLTRIKSVHLDSWISWKSRCYVSGVLLFFFFALSPILGITVENTQLEEPIPYAMGLKEHGSLKSLLLYPFTKTKDFTQKLEYQEKPLHLMFMLGETVRADHLGINGYSKNTTPFLSKNQDIINFGTIRSCANATYLSWKYLFSSANCEESFLSIDEKPTPYYFKNAGYKTILVGQTNEKSFKSVIAATEKTKSIYGYKNDMFEAFQEFHNKNSSREFFILNSQGSHMLYNHYKPEVIKEFQPICNNPDKNYSTMLACPISQVINNYDNTILFLDWQIHNILKEFSVSSIPTVFIYTSDHGEELAEHNGYLGHIKSSVENYMVPLFVYTNRAFQQAYPQEYHNLKYNAQQFQNQLNHSVIWNSLMDIGGFSNKSDSYNIVDYQFSLFRKQLKSTQKPDWFTVDYLRN